MLDLSILRPTAHPANCLSFAMVTADPAVRTSAAEGREGGGGPLPLQDTMAECDKPPTGKRRVTLAAMVGLNTWVYRLLINAATWGRWLSSWRAWSNRLRIGSKSDSIRRCNVRRRSAYVGEAMLAAVEDRSLRARQRLAVEVGHQCLDDDRCGLAFVSDLVSQISANRVTGSTLLSLMSIHATLPKTAAPAPSSRAYAPGAPNRILDWNVVAPDDLEIANPNLVGGNRVGGSHRLSRNSLVRPRRSRRPLLPLRRGQGDDLRLGDAHRFRPRRRLRGALPVPRATSPTSTTGCRCRRRPAARPRRGGALGRRRDPHRFA